jgi:predicted  nucleic acid-binding Zn-ribbon protein
VSSDNVDLLELQDRYNQLVEKSVLLSREIASKLEEFGRHRKEIIYIREQFEKQGREVKESDSLIEKHEEELKSALDSQTNGQPQDNSR